MSTRRRFSRSGRRDRQQAHTEPEPLSDALGPVIERLGGALSTEAPEAPRLDEVIDPEVAARTEVAYRDGELRVIAATNADATVLGYEKSAIARWAVETYSLGAEPRIQIVVSRGS